MRISGRIYEALSALIQRRPRRDLYHSALVATTTDGRFVIEMAPIPDLRGREDRGVVAEGPVGTRWARRCRVLRYEVRRWCEGVIPDISYAVASPVCVTDDAAVTRHVLDLVPLVPTMVWGRDELGVRDMWNSNSVIAWVLTRAGLGTIADGPPRSGRAPGWHAGVVAAQLFRPATRDPCPTPRPDTRVGADAWRSDFW